MTWRDLIVPKGHLCWMGSPGRKSRPWVATGSAVVDCGDGWENIKTYSKRVELLSSAIWFSVCWFLLLFILFFSLFDRSVVLFCVECRFTRSSSVGRFRLQVDSWPKSILKLWFHSVSSKMRERYTTWLVLWSMNFILPYIGKKVPKWLIFFRGVETTNQPQLYNHY